jgi:hypothetical protein
MGVKRDFFGAGVELASVKRGQREKKIATK